MNESSSQLEGVEMRVLLCGCHGDIPDPPPGIVEGLMDGVDTRVVRGDRVGVISNGDTMLLEREQLTGEHQVLMHVAIFNSVLHLKDVKW